jgi:hypothetical protein
MVIALAIADRMITPDIDGRWVVWAGLDDLAATAKVSERTVRRTLPELLGKKPGVPALFLFSAGGNNRPSRTTHKRERDGSIRSYTYRSHEYTLIPPVAALHAGDDFLSETPRRMPAPEPRPRRTSDADVAREIDVRAYAARLVERQGMSDADAMNAARAKFGR